MRTYRTTKRSGFTLVEILIVVIILGILAAIVIPQFTNASEDARKSSLSSQLQTLRSQMELYKLQHRDNYPTTDGVITSAWDWTKLTSKTDDTGAASSAATAVGPYLPIALINPMNSSTTVKNQAADPAVGDAADTFGFVFSQASGRVFGTDKNFKVTSD